MAERHLLRGKGAIALHIFSQNNPRRWHYYLHDTGKDSESKRSSNMSEVTALPGMLDDDTESKAQVIQHQNRYTESCKATF